MAPSPALRSRPFHLVLVEILHQPQYLDELQNRIRDDPGNRISASCRAAANSYQSNAVKENRLAERGSVEKSPRLETQMQIRRAELAFGEKPSRMRETLC
jgi:hypothetical protein